MLHSPLAGWTFVHIQRTGGTALRATLGNAFPDSHEVGDYHGRLAKKPAGLSFAFVRNPWDRLVSWWHLLVCAESDFGAYVRSNASDFDEFVRLEDVIRDKDGEKCLAWDQMSYLAPDGEILVDFIGRFERMEADLQALGAKLGVTLPNARKGGTNHAHYSTFYTPETRQIVAERHSRDIERFGWEFGA